ncbi:ATP-binding protein [Serratia rhizosphaerae]|uniref:ATP-binding protein n=1 Tax=Serratia rhizosphaerae TaxID=2597702 RepID=UPI002DB721C7|nr:transporter substrate-binding domain-containing protein [Serratia rhizosphaerae]MEB6337399.1 transporter substrate-binding domain-containing protein [Serratia rhizosphaerae]
MIKYILLFLTLFSSGAYCAALLPYREVNLVSREQIQLAEPEISSDDWHWLRRKRALVFGLAPPNYPPFDITSGANDYGGINADFLGIIAYNLNVQIKVRYYENEADLWRDFANGSVDMIGNMAAMGEDDPGLLLTRAYVPVALALVARTDSLLRFQPFKEIAIEGLYRNNPNILKRFPVANYQSLDIPRRALEALSFKSLDAFIGDATVARYLINQGNLNNLRVQLLPQQDVRGFSFGVAPENVRLQKILDAVLKLIPERAKAEILSRWNGGIPMSQGGEHLLLTSLERKWVEEHPHVRLVVNGDFPPLSFFDVQGGFRGLSADIIDAISERTGLKFDIVRANSLKESLNMVNAGQADVVEGITLDSVWPNGLMTTRSFLVNSWVLVGLASQKVHGDPQVIALVDGHPLQAFLQERYPQSRIVSVDSPQAGVDAVKKRRVAALVLPMISADFFLAHEQPAGLHILESLDTEPAHFVIGVAGTEYPLATILDKALLNIPPEDIHAMTSNWYNNTYLLEGAKSSGKRWFRYYPALLIGMSLLLALTLAASLIGRLRGKRQLARRCQLVMDAVPLPIYMTNLQGQIVMANASFYRAIDATAQQIIGASLDDMTLGQPGASDIALTDGEKGKGMFVTRYLQIGEQRHTLQQWNSLWITEGRRAEGKIGGWFDVTERDRLIEQLRQAKEHADDANRAKTTFLATMSHEIRTPLNAIIGMLELLLNRQPGDVVADRELLGVAHESAHSLLTLIGDILDISRIESDRLILHPQRADIRRLIESIAMLFDGVARQKGLDFRLEIDAEITGDVLVDPVRFKQVLSNLVSNAIKFTEQGQVTLSAAVEKAAEEHFNLRLQVSDTGRGIDAQTLGRLFQPFTQGQGDGGGAGLGLYISRKLVALMDGFISVNSEVGLGSDFTVVIPVTRLLHVEMPHLEIQSSAPPAQRLRVLVVEDHHGGRMLLARQLTFLGHQPTAVEDGERALALLDQAHFDLIITDCHMPKLDGYSLSRQIRLNERERNLPASIVWGLTANAQESAREACLQAGMNDCLFKPVNLVMLENKLLSLPTATEDEGGEDILARLPPELRQPEVLREFIDTMLSCLQEDGEQLRIALQQRPVSRDNLQALAHKLAGAARLLYAEPLDQACKALQRYPDALHVGLVLKESEKLAASLKRKQRTTGESSFPTA